MLVGPCVLSAQNYIDSGQQQLVFSLWNLSHTLRQERFIKRDELRNVRHRILRKSCQIGAEQYISRSAGPF